MDPRNNSMICKYMQVCAGIGRYTHVNARGKSKVTIDVTGDASDLQLTPQVRSSPGRRGVARGATSTRGKRRGRTRGRAASTTSGPGSEDRRGGIQAPAEPDEDGQVSLRHPPSSRGVICMHMCIGAYKAGGGAYMRVFYYTRFALPSHL